MPTIPKLCGVKRSLFCTLISTWAIIMLAIMGLLLSSKSLAFVEDFEVEKEGEDVSQLYSKIDKKYEAAAKNCYIALLMYSITFLVSVYHWTAYHKHGLV